MAGFGLTMADIAELESMVGDVKAELESPAQQEDAAPVQAAPEPKTEEAPQVPTPEQAPEPKAEEEAIRPVPYNRFKEVNAERAAFKAERDAMANELAEMRARAEAMKAVSEASPAKPQKSWVERVLDGDDENEGKQQQAQQQQAPQSEEIPAWARPLIEERQMAELDRVVSGVRKDYPDMPEEVILSGIAAGQSVHEIAVAWDRVGRAYAQAHGFVPKEQAVPAQQAQASQARQADVAPRLTASQGQMNAPEPKSWVAGWGKQHQSAVADFIKTQG